MGTPATTAMDTAMGIATTEQGNYHATSRPKLVGDVGPELQPVSSHRICCWFDVCGCGIAGGAVARTGLNFQSGGPAAVEAYTWEPETSSNLPRGRLAVPENTAKSCCAEVRRGHTARPPTRPLRLAVRTRPFHGCNRSSILLGVATFIINKLRRKCGSTGNNSGNMASLFN